MYNKISDLFEFVMDTTDPSITLMKTAFVIIVMISIRM
jgi:hypothetical protein